ncbi:Putative uncharacterized protein [Thermobacillus xylanilyticus]|mgnify:CR=1 FL=1|jgi:hypothetical protein|uniref:Uncharacterized protein n=1 Tax=Thermobacillus xylanilyticus TaxID=76633 RepID=A0ABM8V7A2_THEXY|nr:hypothetical protein [Thermobacillus xylanilyticus]CAG5091576.1 Putative uncharacterized protein [Thermobacillus xylanilyticus]
MKVVKSFFIFTVLISILAVNYSEANASSDAMVTQTALKATDKWIKEIQVRDDFKKVAQKYDVHIDWSFKYSYKFNKSEAILIPVTSRENPRNRQVLEHYLVYYLTDDTITKSLIMSMEQDAEKGYISISDVEEGTVYTGIFEDGSYIGMNVELSGQKMAVQSSDESIFECLDRLFENLPSWAQIACEAACVAIWTPLGASVCLGCLVGLGLNC